MLLVYATLWAVIDCGQQTWYWQDRPRRVREVRLAFERIDEPERAPIWQRYNYSFWPTARLHRAVAGLLGRPLSLAEREGALDLAALIGRTAALTIEQRGAPIVQDVRHYQPSWPPRRPPLFIWLEPGRFDHEAWTRLPERLRDRILQSPTFEALHGAPAWPAEHTREPTLAEILGGDEIPW